MSYRTLCRIGIGLVVSMLLLGIGVALVAPPQAGAAPASPLSPAEQSPGPAWKITVYMLLVLVVVGVMLGLSYVLGERHRAPATGEPYESGMPPTGSARLRISAQFYLVAIFFVIFDLEAAFIVSWAVAFRSLGWAGYLEVLIFIGVLLAGLVYLWRVGALDWGTRRHKDPATRSEVDDAANSC
jgi:NADH-quinone oxidoreductase subunit A